MDNIFLLPAALFPAIPLMMINFGNRYITLATLIRKIHDELMAKKLMDWDENYATAEERKIVMNQN